MTDPSRTAEHVAEVKSSALPAEYALEAARPHLRARLLRPTLPELWLFLAVALPVLAALIATLPTVDLAYQLRAGADILAGRGIPATDTWTFTAAGRPWLDQQWLAQAFLAGTYQFAGWAGPRRPSRCARGRDPGVPSGRDPTARAGIRTADRRAASRSGRSS